MTYRDSCLFNFIGPYKIVARDIGYHISLYRKCSIMETILCTAFINKCYGNSQLSMCIN